MTDFDIYLYLLGNTKEPVTWDLGFSYYFNEVLRRVMTNVPHILSNANVPGTILKSPHKHDLKEVMAVFILIGGESLEKVDQDHLQQFIELLNEEQRKNIIVVRRPQRQIGPLPKVIECFPVFNFFEIDPYSRKVLEYNPNSTGAPEIAFWEKLTDLSYELKHMLFTRVNSKTSKERNNTIYLAEVTTDQQRNLLRLRRELLLSGYHVIPETQLPLMYDAFQHEVKAHLSKCALSVHILGEVYGETPEMSDYSFQEIQNRLFADEAKKAAEEKIEMGRILWIQPGFEPYDEKQAQYMKRLRRDINAVKGTEMIQSTLHDLKSIIDQKMKQFQIEEKPLPTESKRMLIISDGLNDIACSVICQELNNKKIAFEILDMKPHFEMVNMMTKVKSFTNMLIISTNNHEIWLNNVLGLLARSRGYEGAQLRPVVGVFSPSLVKNTLVFRSLKVEYYIYTSQNIESILQSFVSKREEV